MTCNEYGHIAWTKHKAAISFSKAPCVNLSVKTFPVLLADWYYDNRITGKCNHQEWFLQIRQLAEGCLVLMRNAIVMLQRVLQWQSKLREDVAITDRLEKKIHLPHLWLQKNHFHTHHRPGCDLDLVCQAIAKSLLSCCAGDEMAAAHPECDQDGRPMTADTLSYPF